MKTELLPKPKPILQRIKSIELSKGTLALIGLTLLVLPFLSSSVYYRHMLIISLIYITLTTSLNLIMGYTGQLALGHAAFYGIGAYTFALLVEKTPTPYWIAFLAGGVMAAIWAGFLGAIVLRFKGHYLAIVTLAFGEIVRAVLYNWVSLTRGPMGITAIPAPVIFGYTFKGLIPYYFLALLLAVVTYYVFHQLIHSRFGRAFIAIRDEENAAIAMGVNATHMKVLSFVIGCFFAGLAGSVIAGYIRYIHPDNFTAWGSLMMNAMVVIGGEGSMLGSIIGAVVLTVIPELLRFADQFRMVFYALTMIVAILVFPYGLVGKPKPPKENRTEKKGQKTGETIGIVIPAPVASAEIASTEILTIPKVKNHTPILEVNNLTMMFGGLTAVNKVDLVVHRNSIHSIIGPNGAGKTTFFNVITGFYRPQTGSVCFDGAELAGLRPNEICRLGMARTFQRIRLFRTMTALDNVLVACDGLMSSSTVDSIFRTKKLKREERLVRERADELLEFVGLSSERNHFASNLPYGEQRRLEIARALATNVKLLILDEPTAGMSPEETSEVINLIHLLRDEKGLTILLIEHDMKVVMGISDLVSVLDYGIKIAEDIPQRIQKNEQVIEAYLGKEGMVAL